ncbi:hypothetical protein qdsa001_116 [Staphylococcus phage qdsa001]|uniref:Uncharacterized protein n=6 Tax=Silviavirus TaxID=1857889 RepID=S4T8R4_9CAUD|nr:hypothetical protein F422_gp118 [Staphylococcus phage SA11]YP_007677543.1 hypothetical protein QLX36_gp039 [Staphylococcus phage vB_SauM_Romulus]YP_008431173.1 hypothetical protein O151_gp136 [Staphylococcus phage vB_SauM_Remus]ARQ95872.1 hypothetical protein qdsa001_116 [Staphylococcus phage qdsa001]QQO38114.1 hypothetical protein LSA2308_00094 [Staphylococcus phage LSA2308]QVD57629.1 hypothetical protein PM56_084 [Staphylococcus phage PM56]QVD58522.1 hypothetical protein PM93_095 [Staphy
MPTEYRDPYSQAKLFIPTVEEKAIKEMEQTYKDKLQEVNELIDELKKLKGDYTHDV